MRTVLLPLGVILVCHCLSSVGELLATTTSPVEINTTTTTTSTSAHGAASVKTGRAISGEGPDVNNVDERNDDTAFDNSPQNIDVEEGDVSKINFPGDEVPSTSPVPTVKTSPSRWKKIPLKALVRLSLEEDFSTLVQKFVSNAKVMRDNRTNEEFLADHNGAPILDSRREKVIVTPGEQVQPLAITGDTPSLRSRVGGMPRTRIGASALATSLDDSSGNRFAAEQTPPKPRKKTSPMCSPELKTVSVPFTDGPEFVFVPTCVRVERCGGCCFSDIMACEAVSMESVDFHIKKLAYTGENEQQHYLEYVEDKIVKIDRHTSCACKCKEKAEDCNSHQTYSEEDCSCLCKNRLDYELCQERHDKVWDKNKCQCLCRELGDCSSGYHFDFNSCDCQPNPETLSRVQNTRGRRKRRPQ